MYSLIRAKSLLTFSLVFAALSAEVSLSDQNPTEIQPFRTNPTTPPATIPAFPEQSDLSGCRLDLPEQFFRSIKSACGGDELRRGRCCPVLATWLYSAYASTALARRAPTASGKAPAGRGNGSASAAALGPYDMPLLPDDSETCVGEVDKALQRRGVELRRPNETCDVVYCYCGIRLHPLSCPDSFSVTQEGKIVGDHRVDRLERNCVASSKNVDGFPGLGGCSKCLHSLRLLNNKRALNTSKLDERTTKMHNKDCEMMGLTWLLAKNRTAYMHTVSAVIRAIMMSPDGADHRHSCALSSDGLPLAVDSSEISDQSSAHTLGPFRVSLLVALLASLLYIQFIAWSFHC